MAKGRNSGAVSLLHVHLRVILIINPSTNSSGACRCLAWG